MSPAVSVGAGQARAGAVSTEARPWAVVVDDDPDFASRAAERLRAVGYHVFEAREPEEVLDLVRSPRVALVVCDNKFELPDRTRERAGIEFVIEHQSMMQDAAIMLVTSYEITDRDRASLGPRVAVLQKRTDTLSRLEDQARRHLNQWSRSHEAESSPTEDAVGGRVANRLIAYLLRLPRQHVKHIVVDGTPYSPAELADHVHKGSPTGMDLLDMLLDEVLDSSEGL